MKYAIKNTSGQWWTGSCWGVEQARKEYDNRPLELPDILDDGECMPYYLWSDDSDPSEFCYYDNDDDNDDDEAGIVAHVVSIREKGDPL